VALALMTKGWSVSRWVEAIEKAAPATDVRVWPDALGNVSNIDYALAWKPDHGELKRLPALKVVYSLGAGVDHLLTDPDLPDVPIVRVVEPDMTMRMSEYVIQHVLMHHRQQRLLDQWQRDKHWDGLVQWAASDLRVGIMGLGVLGADAARKLAMIGFRVRGWSQSHKVIDGVQCFAGAGEFDDFLGGTDILVCLLPHTAETEGILNAELFARLAKDGPLGGAVLINVGRGALQVETDILAALENGDLQAATLDVFQTEPLPQESPLWSHPRVTVTPHTAADSDPDTIVRGIMAQIERFERTGELENVVDPKRGY